MFVHRMARIGLIIFSIFFLLTAVAFGVWERVSGRGSSLKHWTFTGQIRYQGWKLSAIHQV